MSASKRLSKQTRGQGAVEGFPRLLGERLCLDFVNTLDSILGPHPEEFLRTYSDLVWWGRHVRLLSEVDVGTALQVGEAEPRLAGELLARAIGLRETLSRIFTAIAHGHDVGQNDLDSLHSAYMRVALELRLRPQENRFQWAWQGAGPGVDEVLWQVIRSAIDMLTDDDLSRVRQCPGTGDCGGLFFDTSRNASRRWCSMEGCGSRVKMRKHYARYAPPQSG